MSKYGTLLTEAGRETKNMKRKLALFLTAGLAIGTLAGCGKEKEPIKIASKPMTEQYVLTEILGQLIENDLGVPVEITKGIGGGTTNIQPALLKGDFDLYPEYTGTSWMTVLKHEKEDDSDVLYENLQKEYNDMGLTWSGLYGFQNSYVLAVRKEAADTYGLETFSDLAAASENLIFGGNPDYMEREDGYPMICEAYGMNFKGTVDVDIALKYQAMANKEIDVTNAFTTDAQLAAADVKLLQDDKSLFATYYAGTVVRTDTLEKYPGLADTLEKLTGQISDDEMRNMNYQVEVEGKDEKEVAKAFLIEKGLIKK